MIVSIIIRRTVNIANGDMTSFNLIKNIIASTKYIKRTGPTVIYISVVVTTHPQRVLDNVISRLRREVDTLRSGEGGRVSANGDHA